MKQENERKKYERRTKECDIYINERMQVNKKLSCRRETTRRFVSVNILLSDSRSFKVALLSRACVSPYQFFIEAMWHVVPFPRYSASKNVVTLILGVWWFKVIENGAVPQIIYDILQVGGHCKYSCMLYHFQVI